MTTEQDAYFMEIAIKQAEKGMANGQAPFGAVVVSSTGELVGEGYNTVRADLDPSAHGEVMAIRAAWKRLGRQQMTGYSLYTSCEPCLLCSFVITQIEFSRVVFAARADDVPGYKALLGADMSRAAEWVNAQPNWPSIEIVGDFMRERAKVAINAFFRP